jgi:hypothetical protein
MKQYGLGEFQRNVYQSHCLNIGDYNIVCGSTQMCVYCDANWVGGMDDYKSTLGFSFFYWEMVNISWNNKKQTSIVMSSTKIEYMVASQVTRQAM